MFVIVYYDEIIGPFCDLQNAFDWGHEFLEEEGTWHVKLIVDSFFYQTNNMEKNQ